MQYQLQVFQDEEREELRTVRIDGEPWFVLADVCRKLDLPQKNGSVSHYAARLDADESRVVDRDVIDGFSLPTKEEGGRKWGAQNYICVSESGLNALVIRSRHPGAKRFRKWVTSEVLPSIRRTGGYGTTAPISAEWRHFHDRISTAWAVVPDGYFSIFKESAEIVGQLITQGALVDHHTIPDISLGRMWSTHWIERSLEAEHGPRITYEHNYPPSYPQAKSNPQWPFCYPDAALGTFRAWLRAIYLPVANPKYLGGKVSKHHIPAAVANAALKAVGVTTSVSLPRR